MATETDYQVFVTFSGEASKGGSTPVPQVTAIRVLTGWLASPTTSAVTPALQEPRGMAMDQWGNLYVAQAEKTATAILAYAPLGGQYLSVGAPLVVAPSYPQGSALQSPALLHPYGLALNYAGMLFASSQDTNVVSAYKLTFQNDIPHAATAAETSPALSAVYGGSFYAGQYVMTFVPLKENDKITTVPQILGGLDYTSNASAHSVRGIAILNQTLYVVDEAAALVGTYALPSGAFTGWITTFGLNMPAMAGPVGITTYGGKVYIGDSGSATVYEWTPASGSTPGALSVYLSDSTLKKVSGIAFLPDGSLIWGSREPVTSADPAAHKGSSDTYSIYRYASGSVQTWASGFTDTPECLLLVPPLF
jgi:hypothetical protein